MTTQTPRFERVSDPDRLVRPLPDVLAAAAAETDAGRRHAGIGERWGVCRTRIVALAAALEQAQAEDTKREREAAEAGRKRPNPKAPKIAGELEDARRELDVLGGLLAESADDLLAAAAPHVAAAQAEADSGVEDALRELRDLAAACRSALDRAYALAAEAAWIEGLRDKPRLAPWTPGRPRVLLAHETAQALARLALAIADDERTRAERRAAAERAKAAADKPVGGPAWDFQAGQAAEEVETG
jgi:hypothetical protein